MVELYRAILTFLGFQLYKNDKVDDDLDIESGITTGIRMVAVKRDNMTTHIKAIKNLKYLYNIFVVCILMWTVVASIIFASLTSNSTYFINSAYSIMFTFHYVYSIIYFKKNHIYDILEKHDNAKKTCETAVKVSLVATIGITILITIWLTSEKTIHIYTYLYDFNKMTNKNIFLIILLIIDITYRYLTFFTTSITFCIVMLYHRTTIASYSAKVNNYVQRPTTSNTKINTIALEYTDIKEKFSRTVKLLNSFFVTMNIFGIIGLYSTIVYFQSSTYMLTLIIDSLLFVSIELIYIISVQTVRKKVSKIVGLLTSRQFVSSVCRTYNAGRNVELITGDHTMQNIGSMTQNILISTLSIDESIDWVVLEIIISKEWDTFNILGIKIEDTTILQKMLGMILLFVVSQTISDLFK